MMPGACHAVKDASRPVPGVRLSRWAERWDDRWVLAGAVAELDDFDTIAEGLDVTG